LKAHRTQAWPTGIAEARAIQESLRDKVIARDQFGKISTVAGIDVGFEKRGAVTRAAVVVLDFPGLAPMEQAVARQPTRFPYVPGYLSFREAPAVLAALKKLRTRPDLLLCDGQGLAHPRRFGLACHLGLLLDIPSIGVAKSRLIGVHAEVPDMKGAWAPLLDHPSSPSDRDEDSHLLPLSLRERAKGEGGIPHARAPLPKGEGGEPSALARDLVHSGASRGARRAHPEIIGAVLRTRAGVKPVYVSVGHRISLATAIDYVLRCTTRYRLPETTRYAHRLASAA
jgi:deoxyribonuclease V